MSDVLRLFFVHHKLKGVGTEGDIAFDHSRKMKDFPPDTPIEEAECAVYSEFGLPPSKDSNERTVRDYSIICSHRIVKLTEREKQKAEVFLEGQLFDGVTMAETYGKKKS